MIRLITLVAVLSAGAIWFGHRLEQAAITRLNAEQVVLTARHMSWEGTSLVLHDVHVYRRGRHVAAQRLRVVSREQAALEGVEARETAAGLRVHARLNQVEVRRAACGLEVRGEGGHVEVERIETSEGGAGGEPSGLCRLEVRAVDVSPVAPEAWPPGLVDATWTPGLLSVVLHPDEGGRLALELPPNREPEWVHARFEHFPLALIPRPLPITGTLTGEVSVLPGATFEAAGHLGWQGGIEHPGLAPEPLTDIDIQADFVGRYTPDVALELPHLRLRQGALDAQLQITTDLFQHLRIHLQAALAPVDCQAAWQSLPKGLTGPLAAAHLAGRFAPRLTFLLPMADPFKLRLTVQDHTGCTVTALNLPPAAWPDAQGTGARDDVDWLLQPFVRRVPEATREVKVGPGTPGYLSIDRMPRFVSDAAIVSEDPAFGAGHALDLGLIRRALMFNFQRGRYVYGGSTIPQQLVKNLFLTRDKTLARKLQEALIAVRLAHRLPPRRILELYLNCIEFAPNVYGIQAAARHYFGKSVAALTPKEATFLAIAKPNPRYTDAMRRRRRTPDTAHFKEYLRRILQRLVDRGSISPADLESAHPLELVW